MRRAKLSSVVHTLIWSGSSPEIQFSPIVRVHASQDWNESVYSCPSPVTSTMEALMDDDYSTKNIRFKKKCHS